MLIKVEQKHIDKGEECNPFACPVALALSENLNTSMAAGAINFWNRSYLTHELKARIPEEVQQKIKEFDRTGNMEPFEFEVNFGND